MRSRLPRPGTNQLEIERLRREVTKLKAERNNLKRPQPTSRGCRRDVRLHREAPGSCQRRCYKSYDHRTEKSSEHRSQCPFTDYPSGGGTDAAKGGLHGD